MDERKNDNVESLAAFLHSGEEDAAPAKTEAVLSPSPKKREESDDLSDVLFSLKNKKKERASADHAAGAVSPAPAPEAATAILPETNDEDFPYYEESEKSPSIMTPPPRR